MAVPHKFDLLKIPAINKFYLGEPNKFKRPLDKGVVVYLDADQVFYLVPFLSGDLLKFNTSGELEEIIIEGYHPKFHPRNRVYLCTNILIKNDKLTFIGLRSIDKTRDSYNYKLPRSHGILDMVVVDYDFYKIAQKQVAKNY